MERSLRRAGSLLALAVIVVACGAPGTSPGSSPGASVIPSPSDAETTPTTAPSFDATPTAGPTPGPTSDPLTWSAPQLIRSGECEGPAATIEMTGRRHVVSSCDGGIRYLTSDDGSTWTETSFVPAIDTLEVHPQVAVDDGMVYVAFDRLAPEDGGCGDDGLRELGVFVTYHQLPAGTWSKPVRIGPEGDRLQSFRVSGGVLHLTVAQVSTSTVFYESLSGSNLQRVAVPGALTTSLRIGDDDRARIAYSTGHAVELGRVDGGTLRSTTVAEEDATYLRDPLLVLGPGDDAYLVWTQNVNAGGGCAEIEPGPLDGTWFATDAGGTWTSTRITSVVGETSLTLDPRTGAIHVLVLERDLTHHASSDGGVTWSPTIVPAPDDLLAPLVRVDPASGALVMFGLVYGEGVITLTGH